MSFYASEFVEKAANENRNWIGWWRRSRRSRIENFKKRDFSANETRATPTAFLRTMVQRNSITLY